MAISSYSVTCNSFTLLYTLGTSLSRRDEFSSPVKYPPFNVEIGSSTVASSDSFLGNKAYNLAIYYNVANHTCSFIVWKTNDELIMSLNY